MIPIVKFSQRYYHLMDILRERRSRKGERELVVERKLETECL